MNRLIAFSIFLIFVPIVKSQQFVVSQYRGELNIKLEVIDEKRLDRGMEMLNDAVLVEQEALMLLNAMDDDELVLGDSPNYKKMLKKFMLASEEYMEGHLMVYTVFLDNCDRFRTEMKKMNHYASGLNKAKYYERKGESSYRKAVSIRELLIDADKPEWIQYKMHEALELEKIAIRDKGRALQIYQDFPVEYNYGWDDDVTLEELARFFNNPVVKLPPEDVFKKKPEKAADEPETGKIEFRVQIAAHTVQLEKDYIKTFYTGTDSVAEVKEGAWFKYQIGNFDSFAQADSMRIACRVPRSFIVAYQEGQKLTIKEALSIIRENQ